MKIIEPGKKQNVTVPFECEFCECAFECTVGEYKVEYYRAAIGHHIEQKALHSCPNCGLMCFQGMV